MYQLVEDAIKDLQEKAIKEQQNKPAFVLEEVYLMGPLLHLSRYLLTALGESTCLTDTARQKRLGLIRDFLIQDFSEIQRAQLDQEESDLFSVYCLAKAPSDNYPGIVQDTLIPFGKTLPEDSDKQADYLLAVREMVETFLQRLTQQCLQEEAAFPDEAYHAVSDPVMPSLLAPAEPLPPPTMTVIASISSLLTRSTGSRQEERQAEKTVAGRSVRSCTI